MALNLFNLPKQVTEESKIFDVKLPGFMNYSDSSKEGSFDGFDLGTIASWIGTSAEKLNHTANLIYCAGVMITNPKMMLETLDIIGNNILAATSEIANNLADIVSGQITNAISQVSGTALNFIGSILGYITALNDLINALLEHKETTTTQRK